MIYLGTSGYSFPDWVGTAYPEGISSSQMLRYYHSVWKFNSVELNFTYYRMPSLKTITGILRKIPGEMTFSVKAPGRVTHELWNGDSRGLREVSSEFFSALLPMREEGKLGPTLFQFPWSFKFNEGNVMYLEEVADSFDPESNLLAFEFRHDSWANKATFEALERIGGIPVTVDEPSIGELFPYIPSAGAKGAYFRFHGRNSNWFRSSGSERYNYDYSEVDLRSFALDVLEFHKRDMPVYVFFNNCYMGRAIHNALQLREMLGGA
ncbi:DUF72 domain-containing protein [Mesotoga sp.]|uniref:DUF72 domain-containing protein n=1 Tax=Mesotoga sp. TaxID=2053577 RepID=UPI001BD55C6D